MKTKKQILNRLLKFGILFLGISTLLWNCEKEESLEPFTDDPQYHISNVSIDKLPDIQNFLKATTSRKTAGRTTTTEEAIFNRQEVLVSVDSLDNVSYTLRFTYPSTPLGSFYNLNIKETSQGDFLEASVIEFVSDEQFAAVFVANHFDFHYFTGTMSLHPFENFFSSESLPFSRTTDCNDENGDPLSCSTSGVTNGGNDGANGTGADPGEGNDPGGDTTTSGTGGGIPGGESGSCSYSGIYVMGCGGSDSDRLHPIGTCGGNVAIASRFAVWDCGGGATTRTTSACTNCPDDDNEVLINDNPTCPVGNVVDEDGVCVDFDDQVFVDEEFKNHKCLKDIYAQMGKASKFQEYLENFEEDFSVADLRFTADDNFSGNEDERYHNAMAITKPPLSSNEIKTKFNTDPLTTGNILDKPDVFKAVSMIHEMIHAEMYRKMLDAMIEAQGAGATLDWTDLTYDEFREYIDVTLQNKYFGIWDYYVRYDNNDDTPDNGQHQQMAQHYRDIIKQALSDFDPTLTEEQKEALSWVGLNEANIVAWQNLTEEQQEAINDLQTQIQNTFSNGCN